MPPAQLTPAHRYPLVSAQLPFTNALSAQFTNHVESQLSLVDLKVLDYRGWVCWSMNLIVLLALCAYLKGQICLITLPNVNFQSHFLETWSFPASSLELNATQLQTAVPLSSAIFPWLWVFARNLVSVNGVLWHWLNFHVCKFKFIVRAHVAYTEIDRALHAVFLMPTTHEIREFPWPLDVRSQLRPAQTPWVKF